MNYKSKNIIITIIILIVLLALSYLYFSVNKNRQIIQMTDQQKLDILSMTSNTSTSTLSATEKQIFLNRTGTINPANNLSDEEKLQILNNM